MEKDYFSRQMKTCLHNMHLQKESNKIYSLAVHILNRKIKDRTLDGQGLIEILHATNLW